MKQEQSNSDGYISQAVQYLGRSYSSLWTRSSKQTHALLDCELAEYPMKFQLVISLIKVAYDAMPKQYRSTETRRPRIFNSCADPIESRGRYRKSFESDPLYRDVMNNAWPLIDSLEKIATDMRTAASKPNCNYDPFLMQAHDIISNFLTVSWKTIIGFNDSSASGISKDGVIHAPYKVQFSVNLIEYASNWKEQYIQNAGSDDQQDKKNPFVGSKTNREYKEYLLAAKGVFSELIQTNIASGSDNSVSNNTI